MSRASTTFAQARKYRNQPTVCRQGKTHPSRLEARRCDELHLMQSAGAIKKLQAHPQPRFWLIVNSVLVGTYVADFAYDERGEQIVEDTKGVKTPLYKLKRRLMLACHGIEIRD